MKILQKMLGVRRENNQMKKFNSIIIGIALLLLPAYALAADVDVTCSGGGQCDVIPSNTPLFDTDNMIPGESVVRSVEISNNTQDSCTIALQIDNGQVDPQDFNIRLFTLIESSTEIYGTSNGSGGASSNRTLEDLFTDGLVHLGNIASGNTQTYTWVFTFDEDAGNEFQDAKTTFDFDMIFDCIENVEGEGGDGLNIGDSNDPDTDEQLESSPTPNPRVAGITTKSNDSAPPTVFPGGEILGATTLAQTGTLIDKTLYWLLILGITIAVLSAYGWWRTRNSQHTHS